MYEKGSLFVIASPSGGGKTSLVKALLARLDNIEVSVSHTTRAPRPGEKDGQHYFFVTQESFEALAQADMFIEHAKVFGHHYGTSKQQINARLDQGIDVLLDIDWQGARQLSQMFDNVVTIFIIPPSVDVLKERLQLRGQDDDQTIELRMKKAQHEIAHYEEFTYLIINENFEKALSELQAIIIAERMKSKFQAQKHKALLSNLLSYK